MERISNTAQCTKQHAQKCKSSIFCVCNVNQLPSSPCTIIIHVYNIIVKCMCWHGFINTFNKACMATCIACKSFQVLKEKFPKGIH